jgi:hypothetical protein
MEKRAVHRPHHIVRPGAGRGKPGYAAHPNAIGSASHPATGSAARGWAMGVGALDDRLILWVPSAPVIDVDQHPCDCVEPVGRSVSRSAIGKADLSRSPV